MGTHSKAYLAKVRAEALAGGYCVTCRRKGNLPKPGCKSCVACLDAQAARNEKKVASGICRNCCKAPRLEGIRLCAKCKIVAKLVQARRYAAKAKIGLCRFYRCENVRDPGYTSCVNCRMKARLMERK